MNPCKPARRSFTITPLVQDFPINPQATPLVQCIPTVHQHSRPTLVDASPISSTQHANFSLQSDST
jgi:hypothetical protein